jgi:hypothetical protein
VEQHRSNTGLSTGILLLAKTNSGGTDHVRKRGPDHIVLER